MEGGNIQERHSASVSGHVRSTRPRWTRLRNATALTAITAMMMIGLNIVGARAATSTLVSLTFDNNTLSLFTLGYQQALQPHAVAASFYVNSGTVGSSASKYMTWAELGTLASAGDEIGGKSVDGTTLTNLTAQQQIAEICNDRQNIMGHGIVPFTFAYPGGAFNTTIESEVENCGYGNARTAGSLSPAGPTYAEALPPKTWLALRAYAPGGRITLTNLESLVTGATTAGGWVPIVIQKVCSQTLDSGNYSTCIASSGWIDLGDLNTFLTWVQNAGQAGGAPSGAVFKTVGAAAAAADTVTPTTSISCNAAPCQSSTYSGTVSVALTATDLGSGVATTHYTTDGSTPTLTSPAYAGPFSLTASTTVEYRSWDNAGNTEGVHTQALSIQPPPDTTPPVTTIACNGAPCSATPYIGAVTVTLNATDNPGGWGVANTYYTTDGTTPTTSSPVYTGPFSMTAASTTVEFFSTDLAGNVEQVKSQQIQVQPYKTVVSLTFDDAYENQWLYLRPLLLSHHMNATFYVITSDSDGPYQCCMSFGQLGTLQAEGNDIGGHGVSHLNLTDPTTTNAQKTADVCGSRIDLINNGIDDPSSYAYPFGAYDTNAEQIVASCNYEDSRTGGGISSSTTAPSAPWIETLPPGVPEALRTVDIDAPNAKTLSDLESFVIAGEAHGGGWLPLTFHQVCNQAASDYSSCMATWSAINDGIMGQFMDWLAAAGQPGGAPAGVVVQDVRTAINTVHAPDTTPPVTTALCNGAACQTQVYGGSVKVGLTATDTGGVGVRATYYTTDGSTPTAASPVYGTPFFLLKTTTLEFFSIDNAGNAEPVQTATIQMGSNPDPVIAAAGDIACDPNQPDFNGGNGTNTDCRELGTSNLLSGADAVLPLGDEQYFCGGYQAYLQSYDPTWGRFKSISYPVPGDHDLDTTGGTDCPSTSGASYKQYFGSTAGVSGSAVPAAVNLDPSTGYYSYNLGSWHIIALNSGACESGPAFCAAGSAQEKWLQNDLSHDTSVCTLAYTTAPRFASYGTQGGYTYMQPIWQDLYNAGVDVYLSGHDHWYERFQPMDANGANDPTHGIQEFIVGTGGQGLMVPDAQLPTSVVLDASGHGVLQMTLHNGSYGWQSLSDTDGSIADSGSAPCHPAPDTTPPTTTITCNNTTCSTGSYAAPVTVALSATDDTTVVDTYYTTDGSTPTTSSTLYTGPFTVASTSTVKFFSVDIAANAEAIHSQQIQVDTVAPTTTVSCNGAPCSSGWYPTSPVTVTLAPTDNSGGSGVAATYYTTDGSTPTTSSPVYSGPFTVASTGTAKFFSVDIAGNAEAVKSQTIQIDSIAPTTTIACNGTACSSGWYNTSTVSVTLTATDNAGGAGVAAIYYTTDGSTPTTSSTVYTGPFGVPASTVKFFSVDNAGNAEAVNSVTIQIDTGAPATTIGCNSTTCSTGWYTTSPVTVTLTATDDSGGSGVTATYFTVDGSTPTASSPSYTVPFNVSATTTVKFFSVDNAGNAEVVNTQTIQIDTGAPTTTIACNGTACSAGGYNTSPVSVVLTATDSGGPGVGATYYTTDGSTPTTSGVLYTGPFNVSATSTIEFFSVDNAGNAEGVKSQGIEIDTVAPTTTISCNSTTCSTGWYTTSPVGVALAATDNTGGSGVNATYYTIDGSTPTTSSPVYTAPFTVSATTTVKFFSVDNAGNAEAVKSQGIEIDVSAPTTTITCNGAACSPGGYNTSPVTVALAASDGNSGSGAAATYYTTDGSTPTTSSPSYTAPFTVSATTTVKFFSVDNAGNAEGVKSQGIEIDTVAPTTTITCNSATCTAWYKTTPVSVALVATDSTGGSGVKATYYTINGSTPTTSSTVYTAPFMVPATTTVKFFSVDSAGNAEAVNSQTIQIDTIAPTTTITCNSTTCSTGWYKTTPMNVALAATDNTGGSAVTATYYTINGSTPTTSSTVYTAPFTVSATTTVKFFSVDNAGNAEAVKSQAIQIDTVAPTTTITCNSATCTAWYKTSPVTVALAATDNTGGSGVTATYYTTNGSTPTTSSPVYTAPFKVSATTTVKFFSVDNAGNAEAVKSQTIEIDTIAPTTTIACNSTTCSTSWYKTSSVTVALTATDNTGGSGVKATYYTTDGTNPQTSTTAILYTGSFAVSQTTTVQYYSADVAGNKGAVKSETIKIDAAPPVVSITSPASGSSFAVGTKVTVTVSASDVGTGSGAASGIASVAFYLNGTTLLATVKTSPYTFVWNTSKLVKGTYSLTAVATDNAGNSTTSTAVTVHIT